MSTIVTATFRRSEDAFAALRELEFLGIVDEQISVLTSDDKAKGFSIEQGTKAAEGATIGGALTGLAAAVFGGLAAIGTVAIPGINLVASGAFISALAAGGAGAATGGVIGALIGSGISENEAKLYEKEVKKGAVLVAVQTKDADQKKAVKDVFKQHEATKLAA